uniref:hypothetical protein n=1 Tax=Cysteiniphilum litorale TaxID=2056700 RepID=UPI003F882A59
SNELANGKQTVSNELANGKQTVSDELGNTGKNDSYKLIKYTISELSGIQFDVMMFLHESIIDDKLRITDKVTLSLIRSSVGKDINILKNAISRLKNEKSCISIFKHKSGRGGWSQYQIDKTMYDSISTKKPPIYNSNTTNIINKYSSDTKEQEPTTQQNDQLIDLIKKQNDQFQQQIVELQKQFLQQTPQVQPETKPITVAKATETNTSESDNNDWTDLDFSSLTEFGFTKRHVTQIKNFNKSLDADNQLTVDSVQESIEHYAWALQNRLEEMASYAPSNNRLRGLIGVLKKGGNWTEANYKSPEDLAFEASLKAKEERLLKLKEQKERVFNIEFELWRESLTATELTDIEENGELQGKMPPSAFKNKGDNKHYVAALKTYFKNNVYKG